MLPEKYQWIGVPFEPEGDPRPLFGIARELEGAGNREGAATVYDRAYGLDPTAADVRQARARLLDQLAVVEHGLRFCYIPGGVFLMGCHTGEEDEHPCHPVWLAPHWLSETPVSWAAYCRLMDWEPPPAGHPRHPESPRGEFDRAAFHLYEANKIRLQYCEDHTTRAGDWHAHAPGQRWQSGGRAVSAQELFGTPPRNEPDAQWQYDTKPMVAVAWQEVDDLTARLSTGRVRYSLPTEAQWEKAARGGLIGARYAWGDEPPTQDRCDFYHFSEFAIRPMRAFPANGYGLYAVNGGVWEWTRDWYDRDYYRHSPDVDPEGPAAGEEKVLRGGSWADCADAVTVTFRMSRGSRSWTAGEWGANLAPNIGFRLCRMVVG
jgi:formylglycine-generating enzyme required for sulfatase activity